MQLTDAPLILALVLPACAPPTPSCAANDSMANRPQVELIGTALDGSISAPPQHCSASGGQPSLRLLSWNIKAGRVQGLDAVIAEISRWNPDVVLLQEVDMEVERSGFLDQPRVIGERLGYEFVFAPAIVVEGGLYGIAALSRVPLREAHRVPVTNMYACEMRVGLEASGPARRAASRAPPPVGARLVLGDRALHRFPDARRPLLRCALSVRLDVRGDPGRAQQRGRITCVRGARAAAKARANARPARALAPAQRSRASAPGEASRVSDSARR
jgi:hypothetical protein